MQTITVTFTAPELNALLQLINRAVLKDGMDVAEAAVHLTKKIQQAAQQAQKEAQECSPSLQSAQPE